VQTRISSGDGSRFRGGLHFKTFPIKTLLLETPRMESNESRNFPAIPTNGFPLTSSQYPGASPINIIVAEGFPSPGTGFLRVFQSEHLRQTLTSRAISSKSFLLDNSLDLTTNSDNYSPFRNMYFIRERLNYYFTSSRFFHLRFLLRHFRHLIALGALRAPHSLQIFIYKRCFCAIAFFIGSITGISSFSPVSAVCLF